MGACPFYGHSVFTGCLLFPRRCALLCAEGSFVLSLREDVERELPESGVRRAVCVCVFTRKADAAVASEAITR